MKALEKTVLSTKRNFLIAIGAATSGHEQIGRMVNSAMEAAPLGIDVVLVEAHADPALDMRVAALFGLESRDTDEASFGDSALPLVGFYNGAWQP